MLAVVFYWLRSGRAPQGWVRAVILVGLYLMVVFASLFYANDILSAEEAAIDFFKDGILTILVVMVLQKKEMLRRVIWTLRLAGIVLGTLSVINTLPALRRFPLGLPRRRQYLSGTSGPHFAQSVI
jgi:uncharacterized membrane protein